MTATELFEKSFKFSPNRQSEISVPYRVCPLGAHIDHQKGIVTGFALDKGVELVFSPSGSKRTEILSCNFDKKIEFSLDDDLIKSQDWGDYAKASAWILKSSGYELNQGFCGALNGELSAGGLSSSAAVLISYIKVFCSVNGISLSDSELISLAHRAETGFIGLKCGTLDQSCEVLCKKDRLLVLDTLSGEYENIPFGQGMPDFEIGIFFSGLTRSLVSSKYNLRTEELRDAVNALKEYSGIETEYNVLREIPYDIYLEMRNNLPDNQRKRCEHYYSEMKRVESGVEALRNGNIALFGDCIFESGLSSIENYEAGSPEFIRLYEILRETDGIYGARFSGAGFKGCCMAIINPDYKEEIKHNVTEKYIKSFPHLADKASVHFCKTANGCAT